MRTLGHIPNSFLSQKIQKTKGNIVKKKQFYKHKHTPWHHKKQDSVHKIEIMCIIKSINVDMCYFKKKGAEMFNP